ncbi:MAG: T9SS type A sorting domain-containing protein [Chitinophagaceae bacterium]|nr:T9SS type A sorting domain-containing protein [Chitinophagaceae bacterium]
MKNYLRTVLVITMLSVTTFLKAQVPVLSSYPSAPSVLFLDFDGHAVQNTGWNIDTTAIICGGSGLDNTKITEIFNRVAEDYRPFNINVTTDSAQYHAAPATQRMRVIVTVSSSWYGSAGGVAFVGSFTWGDGTPCFVFSALLNYNTKNISEAVAHEAGHTLNLYHQATYNGSCGLTSQYNYGLGSGEIGWAPIMGVGYYQNLTVWHNGPNPYGCTNYQNELDILTTMNGFGYRNDDHAASFGSATVATFASNQFNVNGVVERNTDQDMIRFTQPAVGRFLLSAIPYNVGTGNSGSNLDLQVTLYNSSQTQLNVYNPGTLLSSVIDSTLNPGVYYLRIEGRGNVYAPNYASLGSYSLQGNFMAGALPLHRLELRGQLNGDLHQLNWFIEADEEVTRQVVEISVDGRNFTPVTEPAAALRAFTYRPAISSSVQYRLHVTFDNGREYYSNIVTLRKSGSHPRPRIINTVVSSNAVEVSSPGSNYNYSLYDLNGKRLVQGKLETGSNNIIVPGITGGMYMIRFTNGADQWIDKFVKQ